MIKYAIYGFIIWIIALLSLPSSSPFLFTVLIIALIIGYFYEHCKKENKTCAYIKTLNRLKNIVRISNDCHFIRKAYSANSLLLDYLDREGNKTSRVVLPQDDNEDDCRHLYAYCTLRNELRTFRVDRIIRCVNEETGEVLLG